MAAFDDRVVDRTALAGIGFSGGDPVLLFFSPHRLRFDTQLTVPSGASTLIIVATEPYPLSGYSALVTTKYSSLNIGSGMWKASMDDANGRLIGDGISFGYEWDAANRLSAINYLGNGDRMEFSYDAFGRRTRITEKHSNGVAFSDKRFVWGGMNIAEELDGTGTTVTKRYYAMGMQDVTAGQTYYYTRDHLGSIREVTNSAGTVLTRYDYTLWGQRRMALS